MALSGIEIYKHLPKTNCKKCGFPTCLAFAMKLAAKGVELSACPDVSEAAKAALDAAATPPIRLVTIGKDGSKIEVGNEVVMFRHEKTFYHPPALMVRVNDADPADAVTKLVADVSGYHVERVGLDLALNGFAVENKSEDAATFVKCVETVKAKSNLPLVLMSTKPEAMAAALEKTAERKPLIYAATKDNWEKMAELALKHQCPLAVYEPAGLNELAGLVEQVTKKGVQDIVLDPGARDFGQSMSALTQIRRLALKKSFKPLGYPVITFPGEATNTIEEEALLAAQHIDKYGGIIILNRFSYAMAYPLLTLRLNIYTDPQKPIQMKPGIYQIGAPKEASPLCITTNFSLTYFSIAGELEASGYPSWLLVADCEGLSVLTAWAAGKLDATKVAKAVKETDIVSKIGHRSLIIPGKVAVLKGEIEEELPNWKILVGPREAMDVGGFLKQMWKA